MTIPCALPAHPEAPFVADLAWYFASILSAEYADAMLKAGTPEKVDMEPIGTGPFKLAQYQKDSRILFTAFPDYWQGNRSWIGWCLPLRRMRRSVLPKSRKRMSGDAVPEPGRSAADEGEQGYQSHEQGGAEYRLPAFNTQKPR